MCLYKIMILSDLQWAHEPKERHKRGLLVIQERNSPLQGISVFGIQSRYEPEYLNLALRFRVDTSNELKALRKTMVDLGIQAFLVPSGDAHQSEYIAEADKRLKFISGFSGSSGMAAITFNKSALWTDGRLVLFLT